MALIENTLFEGTIDKVAVAIDRLQTFEEIAGPEGYYLAFGGGKDSIVIKRLADMAGVKYDAHHSLTTIDPPELIHFIKEHHPDVKIERPAKPFLQATLSVRTRPQEQALLTIQQLILLYRSVQQHWKTLSCPPTAEFLKALHHSIAPPGEWHRP